MRIGQHQRQSLGSRHLRRPRRSIGSFDPRNKRGHRRSVLLPVRNRSPRAACRSPHSKSRHKLTRRLDARHSSGCKPVVARRQVPERPTDAINLSSLCSFLWSPRGLLMSFASSPLPSQLPKSLNTQVSLGLLHEDLQMRWPSRRGGCCTSHDIIKSSQRNNRTTNAALRHLETRAGHSSYKC
jgi:hypothetical protein